MPSLTSKELVINWLKDCRKNNIKKISNTEIAELIGVSKQAVGQWFSTGSVSTVNLLKVAEIFNHPLPLVFDSTWRELDNDVIVENKANIATALNENEVYVPFYQEITLPDDPNRHQVIKKNSNKLHFAKSTLENKNIALGYAAGGFVTGNSMEPVLPNGSTVGIDTSKTTLIDGELFAIDHHDDLRVKILYRIPGGGTRLKSFNSEEHPDEFYSLDESKNITILGRIFYWSVLR